jgi:hypothetical protein
MYLISRLKKIPLDQIKLNQYEILINSFKINKGIRLSNSLDCLRRLSKLLNIFVIYSQCQKTEFLENDKMLWSYLLWNYIIISNDSISGAYQTIVFVP